MADKPFLASADALLLSRFAAWAAALTDRRQNTGEAPIAEVVRLLELSGNQITDSYEALINNRVEGAQTVRLLTTSILPLVADARGRHRAEARRRR